MTTVKATAYKLSSGLWVLITDRADGTLGRVLGYGHTREALARLDPPEYRGKQIVITEYKSKTGD